MTWKFLAHKDLHDQDLDIASCSPTPNAHLYTRQNKPLVSLTIVPHCSPLLGLCSFDFICLEYLSSPVQLAKGFLFLEIQLESPPRRKPFLIILPSTLGGGRCLFPLFPTQPVVVIAFASQLLALEGLSQRVVTYLRGKATCL